MEEARRCMRARSKLCQLTSGDAIRFSPPPPLAPATCGGHAALQPCDRAVFCAASFLAASALVPESSAAVAPLPNCVGLPPFSPC